METEWVITEIVGELDDWGYRGEDLILRSDQEGAIESLKKKVVLVDIKALNLQ